jgi:2-dehydro-3-deoxy-D-gluconate 5-dehydrogenase
LKTPELFDLTGKVAVVTGGNGGIGRGIALGLAKAGATVAIFGRNVDKNSRVLSELKALGGASLAVKIDLTHRADLEPAIDQVKSVLGGLDILVNNAGNVSLSGGVLQEAPKDWDNVIETQLNAVFLLSKLAARSMVEKKKHGTYKIQVNAIAPGWIEADMTAPVKTMPMNDEIMARTPAGRWSQPEELAGTALFLASRASDFVTGETIRVDGGYAIR